MCYKRVGDSGIVREHLTEAANALHAAGDKRHLAPAPPPSRRPAGSGGPSAGASTSLQLASALQPRCTANDVLAGTAHKPGDSGASMAHRLDEALALAERSVALYRALGEGHGWP
jgi:hypothetical protein